MSLNPTMDDVSFDDSCRLAGKRVDFVLPPQPLKFSRRSLIAKITFVAAWHYKRLLSRPGQQPIAPRFFVHRLRAFIPSIYL